MLRFINCILITAMLLVSIGVPVSARELNVQEWYWDTTDNLAGRYTYYRPRSSG